MRFHEYLVSYGAAAYFGRFIPTQPLACQRGDRVIVRSHRGVEVGTVLCEATAGHAQLLHDRQVGQLLRHVAADDELLATARVDEAVLAFEEAHRLVDRLNLPLEIVDVEALLEPRTLIVHYLGGDKLDFRDLVSTLSKQFDAYVEMLDVAALSDDPVDTRDDHDAGCGSCGDGGCGSCGTGGGCGSCGTDGCRPHSEAAPPVWQEFFSELRLKMDRRLQSSD